MANQEQVERLTNSTVDEWNHWRRDKRENDIVLTAADLRGSDLSEANLMDADLSNAVLQEADLSEASLLNANLCGADLIDANLHGASLIAANLSKAKLVGADLSRADFSYTDLSDTTLIKVILFEADLSRSNLSRANLGNSDLIEASLKGADLSGANLSGADLSGADFSGATLNGADLNEAVLYETIFANADLSGVKNLETCVYRGPCTVDHRTIKNSGTLPIVFMRGCGLPEELIDYYPSLLNQAISNSSCFISYSRTDKLFARRLHDALQGRGIHCWMNEQKQTPPDDIYDKVSEGIRVWDKVLLCTSKDSLTNCWVQNEIDAAFAREQQLMKQRGIKLLSLIPLNLDGHLFEWTSDKAPQVRNRLAADFTGWETDNAIFESAFKQTVLAMSSTCLKSV